MAILGGMATIAIAMLLQLAAVMGAGGGSTDIPFLYLSLAILPAITEEPLKQLGLALTALKQPNWVSKREGLIAGALAGLSFGIVESAFYVLTQGAGAERILTIIMHIGASSAGGLGIYHACGKRYRTALLWLFIAIGVHLLWNSLALVIALA